MLKCIHTGLHLLLASTTTRNSYCQFASNGVLEHGDDLDVLFEEDEGETIPSCGIIVNLAFILPVCALTAVN